MGTKTLPTETDFNMLQFEKKLSSLKDSQDSINSCCQWCLQNRVHHKKIVTAWLNVLKRVKIEQRLVLFYLANDVVQYSKKKNYEFVESWGTAIQKATTMVRDEKVKHKILRIFKIWEQRGVYNEEFISDLCGLISVVPSAPKADEPHEFQPSFVIKKIKTCMQLETDTDAKLNLLKEHNPKIQVTPELYSSLKDRAHLDDVEKEIEVYAKNMEDYINALKSEIKNRITLISVLKQSEGQLEADRKDVKLVAHAYKMFGMRVKTFQRKLEEHKSNLSSPIPSPDVNAPSPSPDSDIELVETPKIKNNIPDFNPAMQFANPGYYNPVPPPKTESSDEFTSNGFSSFIGSNMPFDLQNMFSNPMSESSTAVTPTTTNYVGPVQPPLPVEAPIPSLDTNYYPSSHVPLLPPPMPPFSAKPDYGNQAYNPAQAYQGTPSNSTYGDSSFNSSMFDQSANFEPPLGANPYPPSVEEYNPEQEIETWDTDPSWPTAKDIETPESPPMFEKESFGNPIEYHDNAQSGALDVDQRVLPGILDLEDSLSSLGGKDVDHRNLISLTGSPAQADSNSNHNSDPPAWSNSDKDYRNKPTDANLDQDYRLPLDINLKLPPPPPPPQKTDEKPPKKPDNVECTDMDLSDDDNERRKSLEPPPQLPDFSLEPPPPLPDLPDDIDANNFLDDLSNDLNEFSNLSDDFLGGGGWDRAPPPMPPMMPPPPHMQMNQFPPPRMPMNNYMPPPPPMMPPPPEEDYQDWGGANENQWQNFNNNSFRGRGGGQHNNRFMGNNNNNKGTPRGRGRGGGNFNSFRGGNNFRGGDNFRGRSPGRGGRGQGGMHRPKGNFRGNFRGGY